MWSVRAVPQAWLNCTRCVMPSFAGPKGVHHLCPCYRCYTCGRVDPVVMVPPLVRTVFRKYNLHTPGLMLLSSSFKRGREHDGERPRF